MDVFCLEDFKTEFEKLNSKKAYKNLQDEIIKYFFNKPVDQLKSGTRLNNNDETPYIKKRLSGSGGYRTYYLLLIKNNALYLMFVHPKTGPFGASNITDESKALLYKKVLQAIEEKTLYKLTLNQTQTEIIFNPTPAKAGAS